MSSDPDTLLIDLPAAHHLSLTLSAAAEGLFSDQLALRRLLDDASSLLRTDRTSAMVPLASARRGFEELAGDLRARLLEIDRTNVVLAEIDELSARIMAWCAEPAAAGCHEPTAAGGESRFRQRRRLILDLVSGDRDHARRVERALASGLTALDAFQAVHDELEFEARIESLMSTFGIDQAEAFRMIDRVDRDLAVLLARGMDQDDAVAAVAIVENFGLDLTVALDHAAEIGITLLESLGRMLTARGLGLTLAEYHALVGLETHFAVFDAAKVGTADERVSAADLRHVVDHPWLFTPSQVLAARALLDQPVLRNRLDTANSNTDLFGGDGFGSTEPGDGLIAAVDLRAFMLKTQLHEILGDYADEIDVANDPRGVVDGFRSKNDFRAFIADNPDLPESVVAAAEVILEAGWFDESWWQEHKDELAMGAALLAGGLVVVATGGAATMLVVAGAGALAAGGTTIAINLATGEAVFDEVFVNTLKGGFVAAGVHAVGAGVSSYATASTGVARVASFAGVTGGAADVVAGGGLDLLIEEEYEDIVHDVAAEISTLASGTEVANGVGEWTIRRMATHHSAREQITSMSLRINPERELRHIAGSDLYGGGGYFDHAGAAQKVLDAVHDGSAEVLAITHDNDLLVRYDSVTGVHIDTGLGDLGVPTTTFLVSGTSSVSVIPITPWARNEDRVP